jgi:glycosyltransferase involved in cell wall biosynthesis
LEEMLSQDQLVAIVVPAYNAARWIEKTLYSALAQIYRNIEIIVVDDGSTDDTVEIVEAVRQRDNRIRLFRRQNEGPSAARNFGVSQARGDLIAPLDADDLWHPQKLLRQVLKLQNAPKVGLVYCWAIEIDEDDAIIPPVRNGSIAEGNVIAEMVATAGFIDSGSNPLIRKSFLDQVGGWDVTIRRVGSEPWKLYLALAQICEFAIVPAHLVGYRRTQGSRSKNVEPMEEGLKVISKWIGEKWPDMPEKIRRQMICNQYGYLAHLALTNDQFADAFRYKFKGFRARPVTLISPPSAMFAARFIARILGIRRSSLPLRARVPFGEFRP